MNSLTPASVTDANMTSSCGKPVFRPGRACAWVGAGDRYRPLGGQGCARRRFLRYGNPPEDKQMGSDRDVFTVWSRGRHRQRCSRPASSAGGCGSPVRRVERGLQPRISSRLVIRVSAVHRVSGSVASRTRRRNSSIAARRRVSPVNPSYHQGRFFANAPMAKNTIGAFQF